MKTSERARVMQLHNKKTNWLRDLVRKFFDDVKSERSVEKLADYIMKHTPGLADSVTTNQLKEILKEEHLSLLQARLINFFEFLKQAYCPDRLVRDVNNYEDIIFWQSDLPLGDGCSLLPDSDPAGTWLSVEKQEIPLPPEPPLELLPWLDGSYTDPFNVLDIHNELNKEKFVNDKRRIRHWQKFKDKWEKWAQKARPKRRVQDLYNQLFRLSLRLDREGERLELVWGHGMIYWKVDGVIIRHPVLSTKVTFEFDEWAGIIKLTPATTLLGKTPTLFETSFFEGLNIPSLNKISSLRDEMNLAPINPWDEGACTGFYQRLINLLGSEGKVAFQARDLKPLERPYISHEPVLFLRLKRVGYRQDIEAILDAIRSGWDIPLPLKKIIDGDVSVTEEEVAGWINNSEELLFPLPVNEEQKKIAERLTNNIGVTVQGPPGTGKSHTIVNLVCHLLALGKRVLITAQAERPLRVLRKMFPAAIRPLCVTVLTDDTSSLGELEEAVRAMSERIEAIDKNKVSEDLVVLKQNLRKVREEIATLRWNIKDIAQRENSRYRFMDQEFSLGELAEWVRNEEDRLSCIPDPLPMEASLPLTLQEMNRFYELAGIIPLKDRIFFGKTLPDPFRLPSGNELKNQSQKINRYEDKIRSGRNILAGWQASSNIDLPSVERLFEEVGRAKIKVEHYFKNAWISAVFQDAIAGGARRDAWENLARWLEEARDNLISLLQTVAAYKIEFPEDRPLAELKNTLLDLGKYLEKGKLGFLARRKFKSLLETCWVDSKKIDNENEVKIIITEIERRQLQERVITRWKNEAVSRLAPELDSHDPQFIAKIDEFAQTIHEITGWQQKSWQPMAEKISSLGLPVPKDMDLSSLQEVLRRLELVLDAIKLRDLKKQKGLLWQYLEDGIGRPGTSPVWSELKMALENEAWGKWDELCQRIHTLRKLENWNEEFQVLKSRLAKLAPRWAEIVSAQGGKGVPLIPPDNLAEAWEWRKAETFLQNIIAEDPVKLLTRLNQLIDQEKMLVEELVASSTWLALAERVTEEERRSLNAWQQFVKKIGKRKGKFWPKFRILAQQEMQKARGAVPVWVMPLSQVVSNFSIKAEPFDVVIIDESSQVDLKGVLAFARTKKVLVVGDDKQISPYGVGEDLARIHNLMEQYLEGIPHKELFDPQYSLYNMAKLFFPGVIMLREHFRCLPEIIQFSNDLMYQGEILPLRKKEPWLGDDWQPVISVRVENGYRTPGRKINEPEAEALVTQIIECCESPYYKDTTLGVISLLGEEQARMIEGMLFEKLGPSEIKLRRIHCGDAYYFQGDQRDVIFLSLVEASGEHRLAVMNKTNDFRRFNVAASRARNQMWLFYSIDPKDLHPEDVRARLINYCSRPHRIPEEYLNLEKKCESEFEKQVLRKLLDRGYKVKPQVQAGNYRIDLVVYGMNDCLAVECDGEKFHPLEKWEEDWQRQLILERAGWKFVRIRGSAYFRDPEGAISKLVYALEEAGIYPAP